MDIPVENTPAIKKIREHSTPKQSTSRSPTMNGPDFKTKLEAATDKIKAYKAYFYDRGPSFLNTSNDSELISASKTETNRDIMSLSPTLLKRHLYANFSANNSVKENLLFSTMQNFYRKKLSLSIEKTFLDDNSE